MGRDFKDFQQRVEDRNRQNIRDRRSEIVSTAMAAVPMEQLLGDPRWDFYLRAIASRIEALEAEANAVKEALCDPTMVDHNEIMLRKNHLAYTRGQLVGLNYSLSLPSEIQAKAKTAADLLKKIEESDT